MGDVKELGYDFDSCQVCGECLSHCPVFDFTREEAQKEIERLRAGEPSIVLNWCTGCMACNKFCENDCKPYQLILDRWNQRYETRGIPALVESILFYSHPNITDAVRGRYTQEELARVEKLEKAASDPESLKGAKDLLFFGCNQFLDPYITLSQLWEELPAFGNPGELCCGEPLYRLGLLDAASRQAERLTEYFSSFTNERLIMFCPAGYNMFTNVLPQKFRARFPFKVQYLGDWLWDRIQSREIKRRNPLNMRVTVQDSCHSRQLGEGFRSLNRQLIEWTGAEIVEMPRHGDRGLCCGLSAAAGWYPNVLPTLFKALREAGRADAEALVAYCNGCLLTLAIGRRFYPGMPVYHAFELVQMAAGERPSHPHKGRAGELLLAGLSLFKQEGISLLRERRRKVQI